MQIYILSCKIHKKATYKKLTISKSTKNKHVTHAQHIHSITGKRSETPATDKLQENFFHELYGQTLGV